MCWSRQQVELGLSSFATSAARMLARGLLLSHIHNVHVHSTWKLIGDTVSLRPHCIYPYIHLILAVYLRVDRIAYK